MMDLIDVLRRRNLEVEKCISVNSETSDIVSAWNEIVGVVIRYQISGGLRKYLSVQAMT
jgi:hypothetical protein